MSEKIRLIERLRCWKYVPPCIKLIATADHFEVLVFEDLIQKYQIVISLSPERWEPRKMLRKNTYRHSKVVLNPDFLQAGGKKRAYVRTSASFRFHCRLECCYFALSRCHRFLRMKLRQIRLTGSTWDVPLRKNLKTSFIQACTDRLQAKRRAVLEFSEVGK